MTSEMSSTVVSVWYTVPRYRLFKRSTNVCTFFCYVFCGIIWQILGNYQFYSLKICQTNELL